MPPAPPFSVLPGPAVPDSNSRPSASPFFWVRQEYWYRPAKSTWASFSQVMVPVSFMEPTRITPSVRPPPAG